MKKKHLILSLIFLISFLFTSASVYSLSIYSEEKLSLKSTNGKFYAYIVLLFNENPHFVNMIQRGTIPLKEISAQGFNIKAYRNYLSTIRNKSLHGDAETVLKIFLEPASFSPLALKHVEDALSHRNIILKFFKESRYPNSGISLDYCIFGDKIAIDVPHPIFKKDENLFIINPFLYYDEFSTSNSTFYTNMIYIDREEVKNDIIIALNILKGRVIKSLFYVGSRVTDDIRYCLLKALKGKKSKQEIKRAIWELFVVHEMTHKNLNNSFKNFDQVLGEELSMSSTICHNPYLGLSTMYSYLNYGKFNPHRIAALNYIQFIAKKLKNKKYINNPGLIKFIDTKTIEKLSREFIHTCLERIGR